MSHLVEPGPIATGRLLGPTQTSADVNAPLSSEMHENRREGWNKVIDGYLIEWGYNRNALKDEGIEPPTKEAMEQAFRWVQKCQAHGMALPTSVVIDPNGGIVFERRRNDVTEAMHFWDDGSVEYMRFVGNQLAERRLLG
jgi:hypothetical protein